jgi:putative oxidoreductase
VSGFREAETRSSWAALPLRLVLGFGFAAHGWAKLTRGPAAFAVLLHRIGTPWPLASAWLVTLLELLGGAALIAGAFVAVVGVPLMLTMVVAMLKIHLRYGFSSIQTIGLTPDGPLFGPPGYEVNLLYIAGLLALMIGGAGALSVDAWRARRTPVSSREA